MSELLERKTMSPWKTCALGVSSSNITHGATPKLLPTFAQSRTSKTLSKQPKHQKTNFQNKNTHKRKIKKQGPSCKTSPAPSSVPLRTGRSPRSCPGARRSRSAAAEAPAASCPSTSAEVEGKQEEVKKVKDQRGVMHLQ